MAKESLFDKLKNYTLASKFNDYWGNCNRSVIPMVNYIRSDSECVA